MTRTYVIMEVSPAVYEEIRQKLLDAGYSHALHTDSRHEECLDMHGIALSMAFKEPAICGCRVPGDTTSLTLKPAAADCPFCDGTGFLKRTVPEQKVEEAVTLDLPGGKKVTVVPTPMEDEWEDFDPPRGVRRRKVK